MIEWNNSQGKKNNQFWIRTNIFLNESMEKILRVFSMTQSYKKKKNRMKTKHKKIKLSNNKSKMKKKKIASVISRP